MRTWSDLPGKFKTDATLSSNSSRRTERFASGSLRSRIVEVPVAKLSTADRDYLNKLEPGKKAAKGVTAGPWIQPTNAVKPAEAKAASDAKSIQVHLVPRGPIPSVVDWLPIIEIVLGDKPPVPLKAEPLTAPRSRGTPPCDWETPRTTRSVSQSMRRTRSRRESTWTATTTGISPMTAVLPTTRM